MKKFAGIDYGSKLSGNTVIAIYHPDDEVEFHQAEKKKDADEFVRVTIEEQKIHTVFLDAPLSLPGKYKDLPNCDDYFYREADKALKAMSPMFLGGLTARAMRLRDQLSEKNVEVYEVYPGGFVRKFSLGKNIYKKEISSIPNFLKALDFIYPMNYNIVDLKTWHHVDALICLISALRFQKREHEIFGNINEGLILF